jgi:hypothetical protein
MTIIMSDEIISWNNVSPSIEQTQESFFGEWFGLEQKFGEFGSPGFSEQTLPARFPGIFGHNNTVNVRFTLFRGDDGQLLCVHGCYIDEYDNNLQKPFIWNVHPDHQRQGIGTMMANFIRARYIRENGTEFTFEQSLRDVTYTLPSANFTNKFVGNAYRQINDQNAGGQPA